ncbi:MAG: chemotaxis protein CheA [Gammaproteobacteria bacterium]|jgi:two-component system chemotaxis sensor kinase CheA
MTVEVSQFHQVFFEESLEHLANMESALLRLEGDSKDPELINVIFRGAHSIKGGGATFGFQMVAEFTHLVEALLERVRSGQSDINPDFIAVLLESVDVLRDMIGALQTGTDIDTTRTMTIQKQLEGVLTQSCDAVSGSGTSARAASDSESNPEAGWRIQFHPYAHFFRTGNDPSRILRELAALGHLEVKADISALPPFVELDPEECYLSWDLILDAKTSRAEIDEIFAWVEDDCELIIDPLAHPSQGAPGHEAPTVRRAGEKPASLAPERRGGQDRRAEGESIRVSTEKIDAIINMVGELVITQSMLSEMGVAMQGLNDAVLENLRDGLAQLERNTRELQEGVMRIRMLPISFAFSRFPRLVHDLSSKLGKKVELKLTGEQTELDKTVMEKIGDPLVHLVRNALDHGIETADARREQGKPEVGQIHLNAYHQGGNIVIEVSDDGAGLNRPRIATRAQERGLVAEGEVLDEERILDLIFDPGFSTANSISDVSGRGVGMDVVRRNIRDLGGNVEVRSRPGQGSCFTIRLPLTLAILDGQLVRVGNQVYVAPLVSIVESLQIRTDRVNAVAGGGEVYRLRDDYIPIMDLRRLFGIKAGDSALSGGLLVVVEGEGKKLGMVVDDLLGQQQVVIKSLESNFRPVPCISGATILGDGTVALILDAGQLVNVASGNPARESRGSGKVGAAA